MTEKMQERTLDMGTLKLSDEIVFFARYLTENLPELAVSRAIHPGGDFVWSTSL